MAGRESGRGCPAAPRAEGQARVLASSRGAARAAGRAVEVATIVRDGDLHGFQERRAAGPGPHAGTAGRAPDRWEYGKPRFD